MKIFLVGFMGCGKTTMGRKLSKYLDAQLIDLDHEIEKVTGMVISEYFSLHGEAAFRELEKKTLQNYDYAEHCVIATGGGTPCFFDNMQWMNANGHTIYIRMSPKALAGRLEKGRAKRPLLKDLDEQGVINFIENKLEERDPYYLQAFLILDGHHLTPELIVQNLNS